MGSTSQHAQKVDLLNMEHGKKVRAPLNSQFVPRFDCNIKILNHTSSVDGQLGRLHTSFFWGKGREKIAPSRREAARLVCVS